MKIPDLKNITLDKVIIFAGAISLILLVAFWFWWGNKEISITNNWLQSEVKKDLPLSSISGLPCKNYNRRPIAVMLPSDAITRPLSGVGEADMVFEMPVTPGGVTRTMAVYQCGEPKEIGSVRSAREDFIPLAAGLDAIYAHWGGEREALKKLDSHIIDNIDAMVYENIYFYRKKGVPQPHNGFTDYEKLIKGSEDLKYNLDDKFAGYPHLKKDDLPAEETTDNRNILNLADSISIEYTRPYNVEWNYDAGTNSYKRLRGNQAETDKNTNIQVSVSVVIVIRTTSAFTSKDYLSVTTQGEGDATIYQNGSKTEGRWSKDSSQIRSKLFFYDKEGKEVELIPGKIWVEIITN